MYKKIIFLFAMLLSISAIKAQRIVSLHTAADDVIVVVLESGWHTGSYTNPVDMTPGNWQIDGAAATTINRESRPWDELKHVSQGNLYPVMMRHHIYLTHTAKLVNQQIYAITTPYGSRSFVFDETKTFCESIKVNQVGYNPDSNVRYANFGIFLGDGGSRKLTVNPNYKVINTKTNAVVVSGTSTYWGDDTGNSGVLSGEFVYRLDLSAVPEGGPYRVSVQGFGVSHPFDVSKEASRRIALIHAKGMYHQRCGIALEKKHTDFTRGICHTTVGYTKAPWVNGGMIHVPAGSTMHAIRGGYHDAADFDRRPMHTIIPTLMLSTFEAFKGNFIDNQYNIPESGNGIPDFLDEAIWGLIGWENLQEANGGVMAGTEASRHPTYGEVTAATDYLVYGTWGVSNVVTIESAGIFAQASRLVRPYDAARADDLLAKAQLAWNFASNKGGSSLEPGIMYAALQLYLADVTGDATIDMANTYHVRFRTLAQNMILNNGSWPNQYLTGNMDAKIKTAHFISYLLTSSATDATLKNNLIQKVLTTANTGGYMGSIENNPYARGADRFYGWGSGTAQGRYAMVAAFASVLTTSSSEKQRYYDIVSQFGDYSLGLNPLGQSYVVGLGAKQPLSPLHADSWFTKYGKGDHNGHPIGNVPGIVIYGPAAPGGSGEPSGATYQKIISDKLYPRWNNMPLQRCWADGWSLVNCNEFTTWETMVWNTCMYGILYDASNHTLSPFKAWQMEHWNDTELAVAQADQNPESDGLHNLLEFAFGTNPKKADTIGDKMRIQGDALVITRRQATPTELSYEVQESITLQPGSWTTVTGATVDVISTNNGFETVEITKSSGWLTGQGRRKFLRLAVTLQ